MTEIGNLAPDGVPYKIVKATKDKPTFQSGAKGDRDALILTFESVRGDRAGNQFTKNYTFFEDEGGLTGPGARYLRQAAKVLKVKQITNTDQLVGHVFVHETKERENKQGGDPFLEFYPVGVWGQAQNGGAATTSTVSAAQGSLTNAPPMRRPTK